MSTSPLIIKRIALAWCIIIEAALPIVNRTIVAFTAFQSGCNYAVVAINIACIAFFVSLLIKAALEIFTVERPSAMVPVMLATKIFAACIILSYRCLNGCHASSHYIGKFLKQSTPTVICALALVMVIRNSRILSIRTTAAA